MAILLLALASMAEPTGRPTATLMPARATVRILSGTRVRLGPSSKAHMIRANVLVEDGRRHPAYLIEFE